MSRNEQSSTRPQPSFILGKDDIHHSAFTCGVIGYQLPHTDIAFDVTKVNTFSSKRGLCFLIPRTKDRAQTCSLSSFALVGGSSTYTLDKPINEPIAWRCGPPKSSANKLRPAICIQLPQPATSFLPSFHRWWEPYTTHPISQHTFGYKYLPTTYENLFIQIF